MRLLDFKLPDGTEISINPDQVCYTHKGAKLTTVVYVAGAAFIVKGHKSIVDRRLQHENSHVPQSQQHQNVRVKPR